MVKTNKENFQEDLKAIEQKRWQACPKNLLLLIKELD
jgi:hypothetical protein